MISAEEKKQRITSFLASVILHALLLAVLFWLKVGLPDPPLPTDGGKGMLVNLGYVDEGSGDIHTLEDITPSLEANKTTKLETPSEPLPPNSGTAVPTNSKTDENYISSTEESPVQIEKKHPEEVPPSKPVVRESDKKYTTETAKSESNPLTEEKKNNNSKAMMNGNAIGTGNANSNGDDIGKVGDKGNPKGSIDERAIFSGNPGEGGAGPGGAGGGASLDLAGWMWTKVPKVRDEDENENGRIVFEITIDENGDVISVKTLQTTVSPATEKLYRAAVEKLEFIKTDNKTVQGYSKGKITFIIRSR